MTEQTYDVVVVGGGGAGLAAAMSLARARRSVLVVDSGSPRNAPAAHAHSYLGREGTPPLELLRDGREEVARYGGEVLQATVTGAYRVEGGPLGFRVALHDGRNVPARRLLVATGLVDELPAVAGLAGRWGRDVLHCPYCHGWEVREQALAVLATGPMAVHQALLFRQWSDDVTLLLHDGPHPDHQQAEQLAARGVRVVAGEVAQVEVTGDRLSGVLLASGGRVPAQALVVMPRFVARTEALVGLGLEPVDLVVDGQVLGRHLPVGPGGATDVPGVWAAGNTVELYAGLVNSVAAGVSAAAALNGDLVTEDTRRAVQRQRELVATSP